jgi:hypothetical protein
MSDGGAVGLAWQDEAQLLRELELVLVEGVAGAWVRVGERPEGDGGRHERAFEAATRAFPGKWLGEEIEGRKEAQHLWRDSPGLACRGS